jgi:hypothetical protein
MLHFIGACFVVWCIWAIFFKKPVAQANQPYHTSATYINQGASIRLLGVEFTAGDTGYLPNVYIDESKTYGYAKTEQGYGYYWILPSISITQEQFIEALKTLPKSPEKVVYNNLDHLVDGNVNTEIRL